MSRSPEIEQRALALVERLLDHPGEEEALLCDEPEAVKVRVGALRIAMGRAASLLPTELPDAPDPADLMPPERIGAFRIVERIGEGGMGGVWLARRDDGLYDQKVAIKLIRPGLVDLAGAAFLAERRILARLEHPNIARLIDGGVTPGEEGRPGTPYLVMEYVDARPIDEAVADLSASQRIKLFVKAADAVQFAHGRLVVHADLKPSNIVVDGQGRVKLLDFGIARLLENEAEDIGSARALTRGYASPARLMGAAPTIADDVYSLGVILGHMVADLHDRDLTAIAAMAAHADEGRRYGSVAALIADLDRWRESLPVAARPGNMAYRAKRFVQRHRVGVFATSGALVALAMLAGIATTNAVKAARASKEAEARFSDARGAARLVSAELLGQLADSPGTFALRSRAVQAAQFYLNRLATSDNAASDIRLEAAEGLQRVAEAQAKPGRPNLGLTEPAMANLDRALALVEGLSGERARHLRIGILLDRARLLCYGRNDIPAALRDLESAKALLGPEKAEPDAFRARYLVELASAREWNSEYPAAIEAARAALTRLPDDGTRDGILMRSTALDLLAEAIYYHIDGKQAVAPYRQALALLTDYEARHPGDQTVSRRIGRAQWALGSTIIDYGDQTEAVAMLRDALVRTRSISMADPADQDARRMVRIVENALGQSLAASGHFDEGAAILARNIAERREWLARKPDDPMRMRDYMVAIKGLGDMQVQFGRAADGCRTYEETDRLIAIIRQRGQLTALDLVSVIKTMEAARAKACTADHRPISS